MSSNGNPLRKIVDRKTVNVWRQAFGSAKEILTLECGHTIKRKASRSPKAYCRCGICGFLDESPWQDMVPNGASAIDGDMPASTRTAAAADDQRGHNP